ncbi:MAG: peptidylprolyl isomerase [Candidatus Koribacter versatilis]|uniref:peptidylprolyl isomerase n=1 Tax=Candidatus Korobacter versatilis TaxID=658062 RepID=A0A932A981_9BACT|nr:peptidylprolyl isomerase [Candidatus Koribacter versatilis]
MSLRPLRNLVAAVLLLSGLGLRADTVVEEIVARINNDVVTKTELERSREQLRQEIKQANVANPEQAFAEKDKDTLRDMIDQQLLIQKGRDIGLNADAELIKRLDEIRKNAGLSSLEDLEKAAQQQGVSYEDWKANLRNQIITRKVIEAEVGQHLQTTPEEVQKFYEAHKDELKQPEQVKMSEILVATERAGAGAEQPVAMSEAEVAQQRARAEQALAEIRGGKAFEEVAKQMSNGPTAAQGGDLGYFKRGVLAKELEQKTFDQMKAGEVSDIVRTKQGFVILKVTEHAQPGVPSLKEVHGQVEQALYYDKLQPALRVYLTRLREDAFIDIKQGYIDSGASPNQTKPIFSAAVTADEKQKKEKRKFYCMWMCKS